jgi:hypothetical protein
VRIQIDLAMNGMDLLVAFPCGLLCFLWLKILEPLPQRSQCLTEEAQNSRWHDLIQLFRQPKNQIKYYPIHRTASPVIVTTFNCQEHS